MKLAIVAVGRLKSGAERDLVDRYRGRAADVAHRLGWSEVAVHELPESRARRPQDRQAEEAAALRERIRTDVVIVFDERAGSLGSEVFAARLAAWRDAGRDCSCVIGGPDGLDPSLRDEATLLLSFGAMTLPHQLVRVLVAEQLYRAVTILAGHPYHRGEGRPP